MSHKSWFERDGVPGDNLGEAMDREAIILKAILSPFFVICVDWALPDY